MSSPGTEGEATDVPAEEGKVEMGEKGRGGARVSAAAAAAAAAAAVVGAEGSGEEAKRPAEQFVCCICMEPWTCNDAHRICCIPCGHVYGRSCLERWLHRCGKLRAKCPQCSEPFAVKNIVNLYAPGNMWDGCCRIQELNAVVHSEMAKVRAKQGEQAKELAEVKSVIAKERAVRGEQLKKLAEIDSVMVSVLAQCAEQDKRLTEMEPIVSGMKAKLATVEEQMKDVAESIKTKFVSMKEQMERLVERNATPRDLMVFMEQNCTKLWDWIPNLLHQPADS